MTWVEGHPICGRLELSWFLVGGRKVGEVRWPRSGCEGVPWRVGGGLHRPVAEGGGEWGLCRYTRGGTLCRGEV